MVIKKSCDKICKIKSYNVGKRKSYVNMNKWENVNMRKSGVKNIFTNILLTISLGLSIIGGTFLMVGAKQKQLNKAYADSALNGVTFISTTNRQVATGILDGNYLYNSSELNYIDVTGLIYYVDYVSTPVRYVYNTENTQLIPATASGKDVSQVNRFAIFNSPEKSIRKETADLNVYNNDLRYIIMPDDSGNTTTLFFYKNELYRALNFSESYKVNTTATLETINGQDYVVIGKNYYILMNYYKIQEYITIPSGDNNGTYYIKDDTLYEDENYCNAVVSELSYTFEKASSGKKLYVNVDGKNYDVLIRTIIKGSSYQVKNDIVMFVYNNTTYYYKNGFIYDSIKCNNVISRDYDLIFDYKIKIDGVDYTGRNSIERINIGGTAYHEIKLGYKNGAGEDVAIVSPIKSTNYNKFYIYDSNLIPLENASIISMDIYKIFIHSDLPSTGTAEEYTTVFDKDYYINANQLYSVPYYIDIVKDGTTYPDELIVSNTNNTITFAQNIDTTDTLKETVKISSQNHGFSPVTINGKNYYADTTSNAGIDKVDGIYVKNSLNATSDRITINESNSKVAFDYTAVTSKVIDIPSTTGNTNDNKLFEVKIQTELNDNTGKSYYVVVAQKRLATHTEYVFTDSYTANNGQTTNPKYTLYNNLGEPVAINTINGYAFSIDFAGVTTNDEFIGNSIPGDENNIANKKIKVNINFREFNTPTSEMYGDYFTVSESATSTKYYIKANDTSNIYKLNSIEYTPLGGSSRLYYSVEKIDTSYVIIKNNIVVYDETNPTTISTANIEAFVRVVDSFIYTLNWDNPDQPKVNSTFNTQIVGDDILQSFTYNYLSDTYTYYISRDNKVKKINSNITSALLERDAEGKYTLASEFAVNLNSSNKLQETNYYSALYDGSNYYIDVKEVRYYLNKSTKSDPIEKAKDDSENLYVQSGSSFVVVDKPTWVSVVVSGNTVKIVWDEYSPVYINRNIYYVKTTKPDTKIYTISGEGTANNPYVPTAIKGDESDIYYCYTCKKLIDGTECTTGHTRKSLKLINSKSLNFRYVVIPSKDDANNKEKVIGIFDYQLSNNSLKILNTIESDSIQSNYFTYNWRYYYYNNNLYTTYPSSGADFSGQHLMQDFDYSPIISAITINGANFPVNSASYNTVVLNDNQYYVDTKTGKLYTSMTLGLEDPDTGNHLIYYSGEVINRFFEYKIDEKKQIVTIFTGESLEMKNENSLEVTPENESKTTIDYSFVSDEQTYYYSSKTNKYYMQVGTESLTTNYDGSFYTLLHEKYNGMEYYVKRRSTTESPDNKSLNVSAPIAKPAASLGTIKFVFTYSESGSTSKLTITKDGVTSDVAIKEANAFWAYEYSTDYNKSGLPLRLSSFEVTNDQGKPVTYYFVKPDTSGLTADLVPSPIISTIYSIERNNAFINVLNSEFTETGEELFYLPKYYAYFTYEGENYYIDIFNPADKSLYKMSNDGKSLKKCSDEKDKEGNPVYKYNEYYSFNFAEGTVKMLETDVESCNLYTDEAHKSIVSTNGAQVTITPTAVQFTAPGVATPTTINHATIKYVSHDILNINVDIEFENSNSFFYNERFQFPKNVYVNGMKLTATQNVFNEADPTKDNIGVKTLSSQNNGYTFTGIKVSVSEGEGKDNVDHFFYTLIIKYNNHYYAIYTGEAKNPKTPKIYYIGDSLPTTGTSGVDPSKIPAEAIKNKDIELSLVDSTTDRSISFVGFKDFFLNTTGEGESAVTTLYNTDKYYYYSTNNALQDKNFTIEYGGISYYVNKDLDSKYHLYYDRAYTVEAKQINFVFNISANTVNGVNIGYTSFNYINANGSHYLLNSKNEVYDRFEFGIHSVLPEVVGKVEDAYRIASQVFINSMSQNYTLNSNNGQQYALANQDTLLKQAQYENGSTIMLQNYLKNRSLENKSSTSEEIDNVYIQFNKKYKTSTATVNADQVVTALNVFGFLKNAETAKYASETEGYYDAEYGIRIDINSARDDDEVVYKTRTLNNWYWFNYFDLKGVYAILGENKDKIAINDSSGLYTLVFNYSYYDEKGTFSAGNQYIYRFYLSDNSNYVEYPTLNTKITETQKSESSIEDVKVDKEIVTKNTNESNIEYFYNFQSFDVPAYIYNATRFNVGYTFKYNLETHVMTTSFTIENTSSINEKEYGLLKIYDNGTLSTSYRMELNSNCRAIDYYKVTNNNSVFWGSLYIPINGEFRLSLENNVYYNSKNRSEYKSETEYYANGRLIRNGAENTPLNYYMVLLLNDLGDYTFKNVRLISSGADSNHQTSYIEYPYDVENGGAPNALDGYKISDAGVDYTGTETMRFGKYDNNGLFLYTSKNKPTAAVSSEDANGKLTIYGVKSAFKKNGTMIDFNKLDDNIYSDVTPNSYFKAGLENEIELKDDDWTAIPSKGAINFSSTNYYGIPLTNLQPIYFNYFADIVYSESKYIRFSDFIYETYDNGALKSVTVTSNTYSIVNFTNKTSINKSGLYVVKVSYSKKSTTSAVNESQYFMFVIDNTAPNMEILVHNNSDDEGTVFISNTEVSSTSRYTNKNFFSVNHIKPNYFQGDVKVTYQIYSYDGKTALTAETDYTGGLIATREGRYVFTIRYGVNSLSYNSTYVIVDKSAPTGELYDIDSQRSTTGDIEYKYTNKYDYYSFSSPKVFISNRLKSGSGATVYAKIKTISLSSYLNHAQSLNSFEAITTNVMLAGGNELFNDETLNDSPTYNFKSPDINNTIATNGQILGMTDQTSIYIIKLYDSAGNESYYYYFYDTSNPYLLYQDVNKAGSEPQKSLENNTTQNNTSVIWGNYKAIYVDTNNTGTNNLYTKFMAKIASDSAKYNGIITKTIDNKLYIFVPIGNVLVSSSDNATSGEITATTTNGTNFINNAIIYTTKYANNGNTLNNMDRNWTTSGTTLPKMFSGDKSYKFTVTDALNNSITRIVIMNSSFAQETFLGKYNLKSEKLNGKESQIEANKAYTVDALDVKYLSLDKNIFKPKITYDYYDFSYDKYLKKSDETADVTNTPYSDLAYDLTEGSLYKYADGYYYECDDINEYTTKGSGIRWETLKSQAKRNFFIPGYPFSLISSNQEIATTTKTEGEGEEKTEYRISDIINNQNQQSARGLYIFRRIYVYNSTGEMIKQAEIDNASKDSELNVLSEDYAVRYYVYYIDRNEIIDLTFNGDTIDSVNSIGDLLSILLGQQDKENPDASKITSAILKTYEADSNTVDIVTSKLRVVTNFSADKYATAEKLGSTDLVNYDKSDVNSLNNIAEQFTITKNSNVFKYLITFKSIGAAEETWIEDNKVLEPDKLTQLANNYSFFKSGKFKLIISDNASMDILKDDGTIAETVGGNTYSFNFEIAYKSPTGTFQTKSSDINETIVDLPTRVNPATPSATGKTVIYKNINQDYLQFTFSNVDSTTNPYEAQINPYSITVLKNDSTVLLRTNYTESEDGTVLSTFRKSQLPNYVKNYKDVIKINEIAGLSTEYTIKIFDKSVENNGTNTRLLATHDENATYTVILEFIGSKADYTVPTENGTENYFTTTFKISVDNISPSANMENLAGTDKNLNSYCLEKYGVVYTNLSDAQKADLLKTYAFPVSYLTNRSIRKFAEIDGLDKSFINSICPLDKEGNVIESSEPIGDLALTAKVELIKKYSTVFHSTYADSIAIYYHKIESDLTKYAENMSYLPNEEGDNKKLIFNKYDTLNYTKIEYNETDSNKGYGNNYLSFSEYVNNVNNDTDETNNIERGYYEIFEEDEAGNISRYLIYLSDNTDVKYGVNYISTESEEKASDKDKYYFKTNDGEIMYITINVSDKTYSYPVTNYLGNTIASVNVSANKDHIPTEAKYKEVVYNVYKIYNQPQYTFEYTNKDESGTDKATLSQSYDNTNTTFTFDSKFITMYTDAKINVGVWSSVYNGKVVPIPKNISADAKEFNVKGFASYAFNDEIKSLNLFRVTGINPMHYCDKDATIAGKTETGTTGYIFSNSDGDSYDFDQFTTVNIYSAIKSNNSYNYTLQKTLVANPLLQSTEDFYNYVVVMLQDIARSNSGIFSYRVEIVNRFYDNYNILVDLPDAKLTLTYESTESDLKVSLPDASTNVKIIQFSVQSFNNGVWETLVKDIDGQYIISENLDDINEGLPSTTYRFGLGSYKFTVKDNFGREITDYKFVGNKDDSFAFDFASNKYLQSQNNYTTSNDMNITIDASLYQLKFGLKNCLKLKGMSKYFSIFDGVVGVFDENNNFTPYRVDEGGQLVNGPSGNLVYYYKGALYADSLLTKQYENNNLGKDVIEILITQNYCYTSKLRNDGKTLFSLKPIIKDSKINEFVFTINWAVDPDNITTYSVKIDQNKPNVQLISSSDANLTMQENGNYYREFQITWTSDYKTNGYLTITQNATSRTIEISALDYYTVSALGGYTLNIVDEIGNEISYNFKMINSSNNYFSVFVNNNEIFESNFIQTATDGRIVKYYYYLETEENPEIIVKADSTKGITSELIENLTISGTATAVTGYKIMRKSIDHTICYVRIIGINPNTTVTDFISEINATKTDGTEEKIEDLANTTRTFGQTYSKISLKLYNYLRNNNIGVTAERGNQIYAMHYYNGSYVKTYTCENINATGNDLFTIDVVATGVHTFDIQDSVGNSIQFSITLIRDVIFTVNGENPINNRIYNGKVNVVIPNMPQYYSTNVNIYATYNGVKYSNDTSRNDKNINNIATIQSAINSYTFSNSGYYELIITADKLDSGKYESYYSFTIVNANVAKMTFGFSSNYGFTVERVVKNELDVTDKYSGDSMWISSGEADTAGFYTITLLGLNSLTNENQPFTFNIRINNETPAITPVNYEYGTSTTKTVVLSYNAALIYSQVGESYIEVAREGEVRGTIDIDAESVDELSTISLGDPGKWTITIYNKDGNFIASYTVNKAVPLNSSAKLIIIISVIVFIALVIAFIILRKHTKFR